MRAKGRGCAAPEAQGSKWGPPRERKKPREGRTRRGASKKPQWAHRLGLGLNCPWRITAGNRHKNSRRKRNHTKAGRCKQPDTQSIHHKAQQHKRTTRTRSQTQTSSELRHPWGASYEELVRKTRNSDPIQSNPVCVCARACVRVCVPQSATHLCTIYVDWRWQTVRMLHGIRGEVHPEAPCIMLGWR